MHLTWFRRVYQDVKRFYERLRHYHAIGDNSQLAKTVLLDLVQCSGVNLLALEPVLSNIADSVSHFDG